VKRDVIFFVPTLDYTITTNAMLKLNQEIGIGITTLRELAAAMASQISGLKSKSLESSPFN